MIHRTPPAQAAVHPSGWAPLSPGVEVTRLPLIDLAHALPTGEQLFARLTYADALMVAERESATLPEPEHVERLRDIGLQLVPYLGTPTAEVEIEHSERHDADVHRQLAELGWDGVLPVAGAGKHWIAGAPPGRSRLMGWDKDGPGPGRAWWQPPQVAHARTHFDDGTTTILKRRTSLSWCDGIDLDGSRLGERALAWLGYQAMLGIRRIPGSEHDKRILAYSRHCRRRGTFLGVDLDRLPLWRGGVPVPLDEDEDPWCAATASETLRLALRPGEVPPHGLRISVRELVEDARVTGAVRPRGYLPQPGDLCCLGREGEWPSRGGRGHVRRSIMVLDGGLYNGLGGNEGGTITQAIHRLDDPAIDCWIAYPRGAE